MDARLRGHDTFSRATNSSTYLPSETLEPRRKPKQQRAREAVAAIEQACIKILEQEGPRRLTTTRIAEVAGVNVGSLYQYFPNKEAIVAAVYAVKLAADAEALVLRTRGIDKIAHQSLADSLRAVIHYEIEMYRSFSRLNEQFYGRYHSAFDLVKATNQRALAHGQLSFDDWFAQVLERHRARLRVTDLTLASLLVTHTLHGAMRFAIEERPDLLASAAFEEELLALVLRYLETSPP
jgi:AcrR family transcriptional regulator